MMQKLYAQFKELFSYMLFGAGTLVVNFGLFFFLNEIVGLYYMVANAIAIVVAVVFSFWVNKKYVFRSKPVTKRAAFKEFALFIGIRASAGVIDMGGLFLMVRVLGMGANLSKLIVEILIAVGNFLSSKFIIFKKKD